ncbi:MAG: PAS domain S-box protein, partial [Verrucomicrobiota bacterium]
LSGLHPDDEKTTKAILNQAIKNVERFRHAFRLRKGDGGFVMMEMSGGPFHDEKGQLLGFLGYCEPQESAKKVMEKLDLSSPEDLEERTALERRNALLEKELEEARVFQKRTAELEKDLRLAESAREQITVERDLLLQQSGKEAGASVEEVALLWESDLKGSLLYASPAWLEKRGCAAAAEEMGEAWLSRLDGKNRTAVLKAIEDCGRSGHGFQVPFEWTGEKGERRIWELSGGRTGEGESKTVGGVAREVTIEWAEADRLASEFGVEADRSLSLGDRLKRLSGCLADSRKKREQESRWLQVHRQVFSQSSQALLIIRADETVLLTNEPHCRLLGVEAKAGEDIESWLGAVTGGDENSDALKTWREDIWRRQLRRSLTLTNAEGDSREIECELKVLSEEQGLYLVSMEDKTDSIRAEKLAGVREMRFRALFRDGNRGVAFVGEKGLIEEVNPGLEEMLGVARADLMSHHIDDWIHPEDRKKKEAFIEELFSSEKRQGTLELRLSRVGDSEKPDELPVRLRVSVVRGSDHRVHFAAYVFEAIEEQVRAFEETKRLTTELTELVATRSRLEKEVDRLVGEGKVVASEKDTAEKELGVSKEQTRSLLDVIPQTILLLQKGGVIEDFYPSADWEVDETEDVVGTEVKDLIPALGESLPN